MNAAPHEGPAHAPALRPPARERAAEWVYRGVFGVIVRWLRVPDRPPTLPAGPADELRAFHPAYGFLRYLKFWFWMFLWPIDLVILAVWLVLFFQERLWAWILLVPAFIIAVVPDVIAYIAIHVRYDTTWYVMTNRSLRIRRGIWGIHEATITFENVQNVKVMQGPVQRAYGVADVMVETAGAGASAGKGHQTVSNQALIEGVDNAIEIRDLIMSRVRRSRTAGLGDEHPADEHRAAPAWTPAHIAALRDLRDALRA